MEAIEIRKVLKTPFAGLTPPDEAMSMFQAMRNAYELNYDMCFTSRHYENEDHTLYTEYFKSDQISLALTSHINDQVYILEVYFKEGKLEAITYEFMNKYINAYSLEELLHNAQKEWNQGTNRWTEILVQASFQGSKGVDSRIVEVLQEALAHPDYLIRQGVCWITFANEDYWETMLPTLRQLQAKDPHPEVREDAQGVINCMFWEEREEEERLEAIRKQIEENKQKPLWSDS